MKRLTTLLLGVMAAICGFLTPAFAAIRTGVSTVDAGNQDRRPKFWREALIKLDPDLTPMTHLLMKLPKTKVTDTTYNLFEDDDVPLMTRVNNGGGYNSAATSIVVDDGSIILANFRIMVVDTGEVILVGSVSTNTLNSCTRGYNSTTAAAIADDAYILVFGEIHTEGDDTPAMLTSVPVTVTNYIEPFRESYGFTNTRDAIRTRGPNDPERDREMALRRMKRRMEYAFRVGVKSESGSGTSTERHTGGFESYITTNVFQVDGALSEPDLLYIAEKVFRYGTGDKLCLCGREARLQLDALGLAAETISAGDQRNWLGINITRVVTSFGILRLVTDHALQGGLADRIHIIDTGHASMAVLRGLTHLTNRQGNGEDLVKNEFLTEVGLYLAQEKSHAVVKGLTYSI